MSERTIRVSGDLTSDDKFKEELSKIRDRGYIQTHRAGDTGIGKTLEDELGVEENSIQASDIGDVELKANRVGSNSKVTLFTKSPNKRGVNNKILRQKYGYKTDESIEINENINVLHTCVNGKEFNTLNGKPFLKLTSRDDRIYLEHAEDGIIEDVYWDEEQLRKAFNKKYPAKKMYHVQAESKIQDGIESFHYTEAYSLEDFNADKMMDGLLTGELEMDIRLGIYASGKNKGKAHDNGTAIRVSPNKLDNCFNKKTKLL